MLKIEFDTQTSAFKECGVDELSEILGELKNIIIESYTFLNVGDSSGASIRDADGKFIGEWILTREV